MVLTGQDFELNAGDTCDVEFEINKPDGVTDLDLSMALVEWVMKESEGSSVAILVKDSSTGGVELTDPTHGKCELHLLPADTAVITPDKYFHGVRVTIGTDVWTVASGYCVIFPNLLVTP
jgi:hypothetical protein